MNTPQIDLSTCKPGQKLRRRDGRTTRFKGLSGGVAFRYWDEEMNTYRQDGRFTSYGNHEWDIVEILPLEDDADKLKARVEELESNLEQVTKVATATQSRLAQLEWRPVSVKPKIEDADSNGHVVVIRPNGNLDATDWTLVGPEFSVKWWRPMSPPVVKDEEREKFEAWILKQDPRACTTFHDGEFANSKVDDAWKIWQAARKEGEV